MIGPTGCAGPIGYVGTGAMGTAMIQRLLDTGHEIVVHNRTRANAAAAEKAGAIWAPSLGEVVERCAIVLTCMRDTTATEVIYLGESGLLSNATATEGRVFVEHGTFAPALARRIAQIATEHGAAFLAAPVSGGPDGARGGSLAVMAGGDEAAFERASPVLAALAGRITYVGGPTAGLELKLVNQLLTSCHMAVAGEAVALLHKVGIDLGVADELLTAGWAQSAMLSRTLRLVHADRTDGTGATVEGMTEVLDLVADLLSRHGVPAVVFEAGRQMFLTAASRGLGEADPAGLFRISEQINEVNP
ncbi:NAD(P)-dependent oxidoreductase [Sphaerimonospora sp. CA-214678]|uniref:NAD(P)-dependent oxidoreductase n=1 Tax=Sphaerimonospora sp. CA-214678 TaxID=3240029 RepID=UPI003D920E0E